MIKNKRKKNGEQFYGTATIGEKGQIVIPSEARKAMDLKKGEKLLVFGMGNEMITFTKLSKMERFVSHLTDHLNTIRAVLKKAESSKK